MNVQEMHYDFKMKLDKLDSAQYRNYLIPEIDWLLNEAANMFIKMTVEPRYNPLAGFEKRTRDTDDIKNIVVDNYIIDEIPNGNDEFIYTLPNDYMFYVSATIKMNNSLCGNRVGTLKIKQHDDNFRNSPFDNSSYVWKEVNAVFFENGIKAFTDGTFTLKELSLNYIKHIPYIHYADGFYNNTYTDLKGNILTGSQDCILSEHTHSEIVDIAILLATQSLQLPDYQIKLNKLKLT